MRTACEVNPPPPFRAEVKNACSYTSTPRICVHVLDRDNVTFTSSMNKNVAATRPDFGLVFNIENLLTVSVGRFG